MRRFFDVKRFVIVSAAAFALAIGTFGVLATDRVDAGFFPNRGTEFEGVIQSLPESGVTGTWQVAGRTVHVTDATDIDLDGQTLRVGLRVEVEGVARTDGSIDADEIEVDD